MIQTLAAIYVHYIEPSFKFIALVLVVVFVLYFFNMFRDAKNKNMMVENIVSAIFNISLSAIKGSVSGVLWFSKTMLKITTVLFATLRDFFVSKI